MTSLLQIRDEAFSEAAPAHERLKLELAVFKNQGYATDQQVGPLSAQVKESLVPQISTGCMRLVPAFREQMADISVKSDTGSDDEAELLLIQGLENYGRMYEEVDDEGNRMAASIYRNLATGNAVSKIKWDNEKQCVRSENINPTSFAPDPMCQQANFSDAGYVCQRNWHNASYLKKHYPKWNPSWADKNSRKSTHRLDEITMNRDVAEASGITVNGTKRKLIIATLINDKLYEARGSPNWYPDFPYAMWRNFIDMQSEGKDHSFWGYGYGTLCWTQQKVLDEFVSNLILMLRNLGVGRWKAEDGAIDEDQITQLHGAIIRLNAGVNLNALEHIPPELIPPAIGEFIQFITQIMTEMMPSLSQVFTGEAPFAGASGRAVQSLQFANFNQLSSNIRAMNEYRLRRKRIQLAIAQQFARKPSLPHMWRGGLDLHSPFPEEARHIGFHLEMPDLTQLPNTPIGRLEMLNQITGLGYMPKDPFKILGVTKGYGWTKNDFIQIPLVPPGAAGNGAGIQPNSQVQTGQEVAMPSER